MDDLSYHIGILSVRLFIPSAQSLKNKRAVLKSIKARVRNKFNATTAEVDGLDKWQTATLVFAEVGTDQRHTDRSLQNILRLVRETGAVEVCEQLIEFF